MNKKSSTIIITLFAMLSMSACWTEFQSIAKQARGMASGLVLTDPEGPPPVLPPLDAFKQRRLKASKNCTQLRELEQKAILIFVDKNASQTNDGHSWKTAYKSIARGVQAALAKGADPSNKDKKIYVFVAGATYNFDHEDAELKRAGLPNNGSLVPFNDPTQSKLMSDIEILGGYVSNDLCFEDDNNRVLNGEKNNERQTIIDGQGKSNNVVAFIGDAQVKSLALRRFTIKGGHAKVSGGPAGGAVAILSRDNVISNIILEDLTVEGQSDEDGGCIGIENGKNISLDKVKFVNCTAGINGGGLAITGAQSEDIKITDCSFSGVNRADIGGGVAVFNTTHAEPLVSLTSPDIFSAARKPRVHFINTTITEAQARLGGGFAVAFDAELVKYEGGSISGNEADNGSGIALNGEVNYVEFDNVKIEQNRKSSGIYAADAVTGLSFKNGSVRDHAEPNSNGGGMRAENVGGLWLKKMTFEGNTSRNYGGGLSLYKCKDIQIEETQFSDNRATVDGGAISGTELRGRPVSIIDCAFRNNGAARQGGAINFDRIDYLTVIGSSFKTNWATDAGGHIHIEDIKNILRLESLTLEDGQAQSGAGIYAVATNTLSNTARLVMHKVKITTARATFLGGGARLGQFEDISITKSEFGGLGQGNRAQVGGDLFVGNSSRILIRESQFNGSHALLEGGSISLNDVQDANLKDVKLKNNSAGENGGALYAFRVANLGLDIVRMCDNHAVMDGGSVFIEEANNLAVIKSAINSSKARNGGGVYAKKVRNIDWDLGEMSPNQAMRDGGGIFAQDIDTMNINGTILGGNSAERDGGNVYVTDLKKQLTISEAFIANGNAKRNAGGLYVKAAGTGKERLILKSSAFLGNRIDARADGAKQLCRGAAGVYGEDLGYVELKNANFFDNVVESPAADSNCAAAMKLFKLVAQPGALTIDWSQGRSVVERNEVRNPDPVDVAANHIHGAILIPKAVLTEENYVTNPDPMNNIYNRPFIVHKHNENKPIQPMLLQYDKALGGTPLEVYGANNREIVVSTYD